MDKEQLFHVTMAEREAAIEPDGAANNLPREPVMFVRIGRG
jgi:hypothetical protein